MSNSFEIEIKGLNKLKGAIRKSPKMVYGELSNAIKTSVHFIRPIMRGEAPNQSGKLSRNIFANAKGLEGAVGPDLDVTPYACIFDGKTRIITEKGRKQINNIKVGEKVLTQDGQYHVVLATPQFKAIDKPNLVNLDIEYRKGNNHKLILTQDHKVLTRKNNAICWIEAGKLKKGSIVFTRIKKDNKKGKGHKYIKKICEYCGKDYIGQAVKYCSIECRDNQYRKHHPQLGIKRSEEVRNRIAKANRKYLEEHPEKHPNRIMVKLGRRTSCQLQIKNWLDKLNIKYIEEYGVGKKFVDFYIKDTNTVFEADGAYWHKDQNKDIERDKDLLINLPKECNIIHIHFTDYRFSKDIKVNPIKNVYYIQVNPNMSSFVNLSEFKEVKILDTKQWKYTNNSNKKLYDLTVEGMHSFVANGIIVSNSYVHEGTSPYIIRPKNKKALYWKGALHPVRVVHHPGITANPFIERTFGQIKSPVEKIFQNTIKKIISNIHKG